MYSRPTLKKVEKMYPRKCTPGQHCQMLVRGTFFRNIFSEKVLSKKYPRQHCPMLIQHCPMLLGSTFWRVHFGEKNVPSQKVLPKMYSQDYTHYKLSLDTTRLVTIYSCLSMVMVFYFEVVCICRSIFYRTVLNLTMVFHSP